MARHKNSLLERAKGVGRNRKPPFYSEEELELVSAWLDNQIQLGQVAKVLNYKTPTQAYCFLALGARVLLNGVK